MRDTEYDHDRDRDSESDHESDHESSNSPRLGRGTVAGEENGSCHLLTSYLLGLGGQLVQPKTDVDNGAQRHVGITGEGLDLAQRALRQGLGETTRVGHPGRRLQMKDGAPETLMTSTNLPV